jgi:D-alanyl-D-alanine carboxypeptidase (penicillin-binding protein 5/6)
MGAGSDSAGQREREKTGEREGRSVTERIRTALFRGGALLTACSVAGAVSLSVPAQAQQARVASPAVGRPAGGSLPGTGAAGGSGAPTGTRASAGAGTSGGSASASSPATAPASSAESAQQQAAAASLLQQADAGPKPASPGTVGGARLAGRGVIVDEPAGSARLPSVPASAYVLADAGTGQVLAAKDPHGLLRPASTLKMLTAITLIPLLNPDAMVTASRQATSVTPNVAGLVRGQQYKVSDLFNALLLISANDAAIALAQAAGSLSTGIALMNAEAHHLQAYDVKAADPNGLDAPGQHVSAYDLALIARQALAMSAFMRYDQARLATFPVTAHKSETLYNQNQLLIQYPGGIGGKVGWTNAAGATYVGMARRNGVTLIVTLLHCPALSEVTYAKSLLNWGFALDGKVKPIGTLVPPLTSPAPSAKQPGQPVAGKAGANRPPVMSGTITATKIPGGLAVASIALILSAAAAAIVLILLRRRSASGSAPGRAR